MSDNDKAVDTLADVIKLLLRGWPIYGVVAGMLWGYGELWLDRKLEEAIHTKTLAVPAVVSLTNAVQNNSVSIGRIEGKVEEVESDTKAILMHLAGNDD